MGSSGLYYVCKFGNLVMIVELVLKQLTINCKQIIIIKNKFEK